MYKKNINFLLFILLTAFFLNSEFIERNFFFNEFFSLLGLISGLFLFKLKIKRNSIEFLVLLFVIICFFHLITSIQKKTNWYYYARNSVMFYSVFSFYFGKIFFTTFDNHLRNLKKHIRIIIAYGLLFKKSIIGRYSGPLIYPLLLNKVNRKQVLSLSFIIILHGLMYEALSVTFLSIMLVVFFSLSNYKSFKRVVFTGLIILAFGYIYFYDNLMLYKTGGYSYFGNVRAVYASHPLLALDHNTSWRFVLWYRFVIENFPNNILGIGFGTPLLNYMPEVRTASNIIDEGHAHVSGAHNTYITVLTRIGVLGLVVLLKICSKVFKAFYLIKTNNRQSNYILYFLAWIVIFSLGLFNLCLESPIRASLFWISLGFVAKIIEIKSKETQTYNEA